MAVDYVPDAGRCRKDWGIGGTGSKSDGPFVKSPLENASEGAAPGPSFGRLTTRTGESL